MQAMSPDLKNVLITGGAGYVGHVLTPRLLARGYKVTVYDILYFGCRLPNDRNLTVIQGDIRDTAKLAQALKGQDAVLHLACISNDASFELDEKLSQTINFDCFEPLVVAAKVLADNATVAPYRSLLVEVPDAKVAKQNADDASGKDYGEVLLEGGLRVDDLLVVWGKDGVVRPDAGQLFAKLRGVVYLSYNQNKLAPRSAADFITSP